MVEQLHFPTIPLPLDTPISKLGLPYRACMRLSIEGVKTLGEIARYSAASYLRAPNFGRKSLAAIEAVLTANGLTFGNEQTPSEIETEKFWNDAEARRKEREAREQIEKREKLTALYNELKQFGDDDHLHLPPAIIPIRARSKAKPKHVERVEVEEAINGKSYEEANWPRLSPQFRAAHNRLRQMRGMPTIPPPKVDLYVAPPKQKRKPPLDLNTPEVKEAVASFLRPVAMLPRTREGFTIEGEPVDYEVRAVALQRATGIKPKRSESDRIGPNRDQSEGFTIGGRPVKG